MSGTTCTTYTTDRVNIFLKSRHMYMYTVCGNQFLYTVHQTAYAFN